MTNAKIVEQSKKDSRGSLKSSKITFFKNSISQGKTNLYLYLDFFIYFLKIAFDFFNKNYEQFIKIYRFFSKLTIINPSFNIFNETMNHLIYKYH